MRWLVPASLWMCLTTLRGITQCLQPIAAFTSLALTKALMWMHTYKPCLHSIDERHGFQSNREQYYTEPLLTTTSALVFGSFRGTLNIQRLGFCNKEFVIRSKNRVFVSKKITKIESKWCHLLYIMVLSCDFTGWFRERSIKGGHMEIASTHPFWHAQLKLTSNSRTFAGNFLRNKWIYWHTENDDRLLDK